MNESVDLPSFPQHFSCSPEFEAQDLMHSSNIDEDSLAFCSSLGLLCLEHHSTSVMNSCVLSNLDEVVRRVSGYSIEALIRESSSSSVIIIHFLLEYACLQAPLVQQEQSICIQKLSNIAFLAMSQRSASLRIAGIAVAERVVDICRCHSSVSSNSSLLLRLSAMSLSLCSADPSLVCFASIYFLLSVRAVVTSRRGRRKRATKNIALCIRREKLLELVLHYDMKH